MDNFREWLSDNLRYIMLGLGIVLVLALLFFGIRFVTGMFSDDGGKAEKPQQVQQSDVGPEPTPQVTEAPQVTQEPQATQEPEPTEEPNDLEKSAYPEVNALMDTYYTALGGKDVDTIRRLTAGFKEEDGELIRSASYIESYQNVEVYTKKGLAEGEYVAFVAYDLKFVNLDTMYPGLSQFYVQKKEDGGLAILGSIDSQETEAYMEQLCEEEDVKQLISDVQLRADTAAENDPALKTFLGELGIA